MRTNDLTAAGDELQAAADGVIDTLRAGGVSGVAPVPGLAPVRVRLSGRLTRCAGIYRPAGDVAISTHYLAAHGIEAARGVVFHELAHHVVRTVYGRSARPHGREFRAVAAALGASLRAEAFDAPRTVYLYRCPVCGWEWRRGRKAPRGRTYSCGRCAATYDPRFRLRFGGVQREGAA